MAIPWRSRAPRRRTSAPLRRRVAVGLCLTTVAAVTSVSAGVAPGAEASAAKRPDPFVRDFTGARQASGAMFRWWWPSSVDSATAVGQLRQVAAAGYQGVEIAMVMDSADYVVDPDAHSYGDVSWRRAVKAVLAEGTRLNVQVDLTLGSRWPTAIPGLDVTSEAASQELVTGSAVVRAGTSWHESVPRPPDRTYPDRTSQNGVVTSTTKTSPPTYVTATATRCAKACTEATPQLDLTTVTDISRQVKNGTVSWKAPASGTWMVTGYWHRGTAQRNDAPYGNTTSPLSDPESRVVNHFSKAGADRFTSWFGGLLDAETRRLLKANGGSIFEDSLELKGAQMWSADFLSAFERTNGYSVVPYLPVLAQVESTEMFGEPSAVYAFADGQSQIAERVRWDLEQTLNELYLENHVQPIRAWANRLGLTFRAQPYGEPIDLGGAAKALDVTECESLGCAESQFRTAATGVALAGKRILSSEMLPGGFGNLYGMTQAQIVAQANKEYSLGANQMVFHGLPYPVVPPSADGSVRDSSAYWPGFHAFGARIGEAFGPRQPSWTMESDVADYYARMQQTLQTGRAGYDVAVLNQVTSGGTATHDGSFLAGAGYTYGYVTPGSLAGQPVTRGVLAPGRGDFKALVVDSSPIDVETARDVARVAEAGMQVVIVGDGPQRTRGYAGDAAKAAGQDRAVRTAFARIVGRPNVAKVADDAGAVAELARQGLRPEADVADKGVKAIVRKDADNRYYVLVNRTDKPVTTSVALAGAKGTVPYALDPWSGKVAAVGSYATSGSRTSLAVSLPAGAAKIVALAGRTFTGTEAPAVHVVSTTTADARWTKDRVTVTATGNGRYTTVLSDSRTVTTDITGVPAEQTLGDWTLALDEWLPGREGDASSTTRHRTHTFADVALKSWTEIPGIRDAVGVGTYTTTFQVPAGIRDGGALLDLGAVSGTYRVWVNGKRVPAAEHLGTVIDLGELVKSGRNTLRIEVASPLLNRLRAYRPAEFGARNPTVNGLLGPVTLSPYRVQTTR
ncbi:glycosyl hydrolase [Streptomyces sp. NPDC058001]|uniref:glycosyl hydrolase n=1 Tax=Streptomyces sp. NPDC058001 TaxID=3346300 RepID=UPI0036F0A9B7